MPINILSKAIETLEIKAFAEAENNDFEMSAAHLKSCEILKDLIEVQVAVKQHDYSRIKIFSNAF